MFRQRATVQDGSATQLELAHQGAGRLGPAQIFFSHEEDEINPVSLPGTPAPRLPGSPAPRLLGSPAPRLPGTSARSRILSRSLPRRDT